MGEWKSFLTFIFPLSLAKNVNQINVGKFSHFHFSTFTQIQNSADCFGGVARVHQRQKEIREEDPEAIFLNAGDFYQVWKRTHSLTLLGCREPLGTQSWSTVQWWSSATCSTTRPWELETMTLMTLWKALCPSLSRWRIVKNVYFAKSRSTFRCLEPTSTPACPASQRTITTTRWN